MVDDLLVAVGSEGGKRKGLTFSPHNQIFECQRLKIKISSTADHLEHLNTSYIHYVVTMMHQLASSNTLL